MKRLLASLLLLSAAMAQAQIAVGGATVAMSGGGATFPEPFANPLPGLWQCRNGNGPSMRRELGPAMGFVSDSYTSPIDGVTTTWAEKDSWTYTGEMYLTAGTTYTFATRIDDYTTIAIDGKPILNQGGCAFATGQYACRTTGWHDISIKIWDTGGGYGVCGGFTPGVAYNTTGQTTQTPLNGWTRLIDSGNGSLLRTRGPTSGVFVSAQMRESDPTVMDVDYIVYTDPNTTPTVNVRALAFEDGERSFWKVVRPETFIEGTDANLGDGIAANVAHRLSWKVSSDWATDLAKVKFEILVCEHGVLPLHNVTIPSVGDFPDITFSTNEQTDSDVFNAMLWYYASGEPGLTIADGHLKTDTGRSLVNGDTLGNNFNCVEYIADKMGLEVFGMTTAYHYACGVCRKFHLSALQLLCRKGMLSGPGSVYVGENAYCVIDVSGGPTAASYPVTCLDSFPIAGWSDEYKTTKILLRRIEPGAVKMGDTKPVTLTKPFYIGVFEITQKQYQLVTGSNPSSYKGDMRPVEKVSWNAIRGDSSTYNWPSSANVDSSTFMGRLRAKTGLDFDLPTESQWEYACRAGTTSYYNNGGSSDNDLKQLGRFNGNTDDGRGGYSGQHTTVGSYAPNAWGLYDMHGNVWEWCLDWNGGINSNPATDWQGDSSGSSRVLRGGGWYYSSGSARSSNRSSLDPLGGYDYYGFRLSRTLP